LYETDSEAISFAAGLSRPVWPDRIKESPSLQLPSRTTVDLHDVDGTSARDVVSVTEAFMKRSFIFTVLAAVLAGACGSNPMNPSTSSGGGGTVTADVTITIQGQNGASSFAPNPSTAKVGQKVAWRNGDNTTHTATQDGTSGFATGNVNPGATSAAITMNTAGTFTYHCSIHPGMVGTLTVTQ
jgi:plastocyanin